MPWRNEPKVAVLAGMKLETRRDCTGLHGPLVFLCSGTSRRQVLRGMPVASAPSPGLR